MSGIHPSAHIDPSADIHPGAEIGAFCVVGPNVSIGPGCELRPHAVIRSNTVLGADNRIYSFSVLGEDPQDLKYGGEETWLRVGRGNTFREFSSIHRGTQVDRGETTIGDNCLIMAYVHVAHDAVLGSDIIMSSHSGVAGHCAVGDHAILGGGVLVHQRVQIGAQSFSALGSIVIKDVPAFMTVRGDPCKVYGLNIEGLRRRGMSAETRRTLRRAYHILYSSGHTTDEACDRLAELAEQCEEVAILLESVQQSQRGIVRPSSTSQPSDD
ncbi:MAG: acyl-ACP--UDP-N-acetylglucosamine O-acyltransferase [Gammaproteobacteria bacterium AqS3]|nr:acyl-ACP--UDP-N-acetylglucosamine O-acyltransferase [Gammaproteobacteria bacterium AqS3]